MKRNLAALVAATGLLLLAGPSAKASLITADSLPWTYSTTAPAAVTADANPGAGISFTSEPQRSAVGSSDIVITNLRTFSAAPGDSPDAIVKNGAYSVALALTSTDDKGSHPANFTFTGTLSGTFSSENANVKNVFGPNTTQTQVLGDFTFTVALYSPYTPPGPPDQANAGSIAAHVTITDNRHPGPLTPEPSTMLLSGLGLTFLGAASWRKRRALAKAKALADVA